MSFRSKEWEENCNSAMVVEQNRNVEHRQTIWNYISFQVCWFLLIRLYHRGIWFAYEKEFTRYGDCELFVYCSQVKVENIYCVSELETPINNINVSQTFILQIKIINFPFNGNVSIQQSNSFLHCVEVILLCFPLFLIIFILHEIESGSPIKLAISRESKILVPCTGQSINNDKI